MQVVECAKEIKIPIKQDPCVICFDTVDNNGNCCSKSTSLLVADCECSYAIHKTCLSEWMINRPTDEVRCLICSSHAEPVLSCCERSIDCLRRARASQQSRKLFVCVGWIMIFLFIWVVIGNTELLY